MFHGTADAIDDRQLVTGAALDHQHRAVVGSTDLEAGGTDAFETHGIVTALFEDSVGRLVGPRPAIARREEINVVTGTAAEVVDAAAIEHVVATKSSQEIISQPPNPIRNAGTQQLGVCRVVAVVIAVRPVDLKALRQNVCVSHHVAVGKA